MIEGNIFELYFVDLGLTNSLVLFCFGIVGNILSLDKSSTF